MTQITHTSPDRDALAPLPPRTAWLVARRAWFPRMRRESAVGLVVNTGIRRVYACALCGARCSQAVSVSVVAKRGRYAGSSLTIRCRPTAALAEF